MLVRTNTMKLMINDINKLCGLNLPPPKIPIKYKSLFPF